MMGDAYAFEYTVGNIDDVAEYCEAIVISICGQ